MRLFAFKFTLATALLVASGAVFAQSMPTVPLDPAIRKGKLDNGLTYYIRANKEPRQRADFYIAQNVGAILENDNQNGLAHFLEHMAFNGTKNFPGKGIINYLEKIGVKFGADINAHTGLDETVYTLCDVPTTREGIVDSALLILHDWSNYISLEDNEIDAERGVIREEWRTGAGAERRMWKESNKQKFAGSQYARRDVIGDTAIINNFSYKTLRDFYKKWYHPDLQAILIVGDVDVDKVEAQIKAMFSSIPKNPNPGMRPVYTIADNDEPIICLVKDAEARMTRIELEYKHEKMSPAVLQSVQGYGVGVVNSLISQMLGYRFEEITQKADAPFVGAYGSYGELVKSKDAFQMLAVPKEGQEEAGLRAILTEAERMKRFGFTVSELERARTEMLKAMEKSYNEREHQKNNSLIEEYVRNFLDNENIPGIEWEYNTLKTILPQLRLEVVNELARSYVIDSNLIVSIMAPDKPAVIVPGREHILQIIHEVKNMALTAPVDETLNKPLVEKMPKAGRIVKQNENKVLGTTEWLLSNGVKVVLKPTTFKKDEILLSAYSDGGLSKVKNPADLATANLTAAIVANNGLGNYSLVELNKLLTGKIVSLSPEIQAYEEGFSGSSSVSDFETMMQLVYLYFTAVRKDDNAFAAMMNGYKALMANGQNDPRRAFSDSVSLTLSNHNKRTVLMNLKTLESVSQDKALEIYRERFAVPADFCFVLTGNVNPSDESFQKTVCLWLGSLKSKKGGEKITDNGVRKPKGMVSNYFSRDMKVKKASNFVLYSGSMPYSLQNSIVLSAIGDLLDMRYIESVREKEGGTYGVGVRGSLLRIPVQEALLLMQFDTDPVKQQRLIGIIHAEVRKIVAEGPIPADLDKVKENLLKKYNEDLAQNGWWAAAVEGFYHNNINLVTDYKAAVDALTPGLIQVALKNLVEQGNVVEVVMKPAE